MSKKILVFFSAKLIYRKNAVIKTYQLPREAYRRETWIRKRKDLGYRKQYV